MLLASVNVIGLFALSAATAPLELTAPPSAGVLISKASCLCFKLASTSVVV
jgi:hypothetical protein